MKISTYTGGFVQTNGYVIDREEGALVIDAPAGIFDFCSEQNIEVTDLLLTHQHFDHVEDVARLRNAGATIHASAPYSPQLVLDEGARLMGLPVRVDPFEVDEILSEGPLRLAGVEFELMAVPGHSPDSFVFLCAESGDLFAGDTLFSGSIGRTDLPGGDHALLLRGIRERLLTLAPATKVLSGHGPPTTIEAEAASNPFLA